MPEAAAAAAAAIAASVAKAVAEAVATEKASAAMILLATRTVKLETESAEQGAKLEAIQKAIDRWKGGLLVVLAVASFVAWITSVSSSIKGFFR